MLDQATIELLHSGCAVLIGSVDAHGWPHAGRGWGVTVLGGEPLRLRVLVDVEDTVSLANLRDGVPVAVTASDVRTLQSVQLKGRVVATEHATAADVAKKEQYRSDFVQAIHDTDGDPLHILDRWSARGVVACVVEVDATFDQTPGPAAGARIGGTAA